MYSERLYSFPMAQKKGRVLVTGAGGFIGHRLVRRLAEAGAKVRAFVHYNSLGSRGLLERLDAKTLRNVEIFPGDITDPGRVADAVEGCRFVFHLAALISIPYSYRSRRTFLQVNAGGTQNILEAALRHGPERVVTTSTSEVYGTARRVPMDETHPLQPQSPYAASKAAADLLALSYHRTFGLPVCVLRPFNVFGPGQSLRAVIPTILAQALRTDRLRLGAVDPVRDFTYVEDTVEAFLSAGACRGAGGRVLNVGTGKGFSVREIVSRAAVLAGHPLKVETEKSRLRPVGSEVLRLVCDASEMRKLTGWKPEVSFDDGLARTAEYVRSQAGNLRWNEFHF